MNLQVFGFGALLILAGVICQQVYGDDAATDAKALVKFNGNWELVSSTNDGKWADLSEVRGGVLVFDGGYMAAVERGQAVGYGAIKVDAVEARAEIDWRYGDSPAKTGTSKGIYKFDEDGLTMCFGELDPRNGQSKFRPSRFESREGSKTILLVYKRVDRRIRLQDFPFPDYLKVPPSK